MKNELNTVSFLVYGSKAIFTDPLTKTSGERHTYPVPTYEALRGVLESCYWKPTIRWVIDRVRIMTPIQKETVSLRLPKYSSNKTDRSYNTYLTDVAYQVEAHFEWSENEGFETDRNTIKHLTIANRSIARGGRYDIYLGGRECQAYLEPCQFGEGEGAYDHTPTVYFGLMFHGYTYPNMCGENKLYARFWDAVMENGVITYPVPEECKVVRYIRDMVPKKFPPLEDKREKEEPISEEISIPTNIPGPFMLEQQYPEQPGGDMRSWAAKLCETYDNLVQADLECEEELGILYPGLINKDAQFEVTLDGDGNLVPDGIRIVPEEEAKTVIPCSLTSQFRTMQKDPHLLFDFLEYLAGDYGNYIEDSGNSHAQYIEQLLKWIRSEARHPFAEIIYLYLSKGTLMADLDAAGVLPISKDTEGKGVLPRWPKTAGSGMVRFKIQIEGMNPEIWNERSLWQSAVDFNRLQAVPKAKDVCYVTGATAFPAPVHPYVRGTTKLISSGDKTDFTYRCGGWDKPEDCLQMSYEASQKIHLALRWLMQHQSFNIGAQAYVIWSTHNLTIPRILANGPELSEQEANVETVGTQYAAEVRNYVIGRHQNIPDNDEVHLLTMASPAPGRISITQYESMASSIFFEHLQNWYKHTICKLPVKGGTTYRAPTIYEIADVACGTVQSPANRERVMQDILRSIILGCPIPRRMVESMISNVIKRFSVGAATNTYDPAYDKALNITTAIVRKYLNDIESRGQNIYREVWTIPLNQETKDRSYLLGRLLAYYYRIDYMSQRLGGNGYRTTNAERMMAQYQNRPGSVIKILNTRIISCKTRLSKVSYGRSFLMNMDEFIASIPIHLLNDAPLTESFILGYHAQLNEFSNRKDNGGNHNDSSEE